MASTEPSSERPRWWGPDLWGLPVAFYLSVALSAGATGTFVWLLLEYFDPSLFRPIPESLGTSHQAPREAGAMYAALAATIGTLPAFFLWRSALHRRGLRSWDD